MRITDRPPTPVSLSDGTVNIATQRWELEPWQGAPDPSELPRPWGIKPKFAVGGRRSCAELAVVDHLRRDGWDGVWVSAFGGSWLRAEWFPAPAFRTLADAGAPVWAVQAFKRLRAANDGKLSGFFDVFAWRAPDEVRFVEIKVAKDGIRPTQRKFLERALRFHDPDRFMIVEIPGGSYMSVSLEPVSRLLHEAAETHHRVFRIVDGADDDWASWYADWLANLSELPALLGGKAVRSELTYLLVSLDKEYTAGQPAEPWEDYYARRILDHFNPSAR